MIQITKHGSLYNVKAIRRDGRVLKLGPLTSGEVMKTLNEHGFHHTDIGDALNDCDPTWGGPVPKLTDDQRSEVRALFDQWGVNRVFRRQVGSFAKEFFLVDPDDVGRIDFRSTDTQNRHGVSDDVAAVERALEAILPDRGEVNVRLLSPEWEGRPQEQV